MLHPLVSLYSINSIALYGRCTAPVSKALLGEVMSLGTEFAPIPLFLRGTVWTEGQILPQTFFFNVFCRDVTRVEGEGAAESRTRVPAPGQRSHTQVGTTRLDSPGSRSRAIPNAPCRRLFCFLLFFVSFTLYQISKSLSSLAVHTVVQAGAGAAPGHVAM